MRNAFQLYLLSKMSACDLVDTALKRLGFSRAQMKVAARRVATDFLLDQPAHAADIYEDLAGPATAERKLATGETSAAFEGSTRRQYSLPLWPAVQFVVNRHPSGYAWGEKFAQREASDTGGGMLLLPERVRPWGFAADAILSRAVAVETLDNWTDFLLVRATFLLSDGRAAVFRARFDLELLQSWHLEA
jgi:hypothetical protein